MKNVIRINFLLLSLCIWNIQAFGQEIKALTDLADKGGNVEVAVPKDGSHTKGEKICFQNEKSKQVGCGKIYKVADESIFVRVTTKTFAKLKDDYTAVLDGVSSDEAAAEGAATTAKKTGAIAGPKSILRLTYSPALVAPTAYHLVTYKAPSVASASTPTTDSLWVSDKAATLDLVSAGFEYGRVLGPKSAWLLGLRYRMNPEATVLADYIANVSTSYITIKHKFSALALSSDYAFYMSEVSKQSNLFFAMGLDLENSTLAVTSTVTDDTAGTSADLGSLTSKLTVASLRLRSGFDWGFSKSICLNMGLTAMIPLAKFSANASASVNDPHAADQTSAGDDLKAAAAHTKASFGALLDLGLTAKF